jgi:hypothetical protein
MIHLHFLCARRLVDAVTQVEADGETEITIAMGHANKIQVWRVRVIKYITKMVRHQKKNNTTI